MNWSTDDHLKLRQYITQHKHRNLHIRYRRNNNDMWLCGVVYKNSYQTIQGYLSGTNLEYEFEVDPAGTFTVKQRYRGSQKDCLQLASTIKKKCIARILEHNTKNRANYLKKRFYLRRNANPKVSKQVQKVINSNNTPMINQNFVNKMVSWRLAIVYPQ